MSKLAKSLVYQRFEFSWPKPQKIDHPLTFLSEIAEALALIYLDCKTVVFFRWLARKGAKRRASLTRAPQSHSAYSHSLQTFRSKTARIRMTNAKNTTVLQSNSLLVIIPAPKLRNICFNYIVRSSLVYFKRSLNTHLSKLAFY